MIFLQGTVVAVAAMEEDMEKVCSGCYASALFDALARRKQPFLEFLRLINLIRLYPWSIWKFPYNSHCNHINILGHGGGGGGGYGHKGNGEWL